MEATDTKLVTYLNATLGIKIELVEWEAKTRLPFFLQERYRFFQAWVFNKNCLFVLDTQSKEDSPAIIGKHFSEIQTKWEDIIIYVRDRIVAYNRKRLVEYKIPFIVPGTQMFLPPIGVDFREYFRPLERDIMAFRPTTQLVLIYALLHDDILLAPTALAKKFGYSAMTMSRAIDELETMELVLSIRSSRERQVRFSVSKRDVWERAKIMLKSPIAQQHLIRESGNELSNAPRAGFEALSHYSMLTSPRSTTVAISREQWKASKENALSGNLHNEYPGTLMVEVWRYPPTALAQENYVDPLSLYLSLKETKDERVQEALEHIIGGIL